MRNGARPENHIHTVEPLNNGHIGTHHFVHYREVVLFQRQKMYCHYIDWCIGKCPLYRGVLYSECPLSEVPLYNLNAYHLATLHLHLMLLQCRRRGCITLNTSAKRKVGREWLTKLSLQLQFTELLTYCLT